MLNWELLYNKFGRKKAAEKFEDMALDYVSDTYSEYTWKPTGRTRDGNRDFHNLEDKLLNIWGEAKYKKGSTRLTRKDLDPTILSGLIDGTVSLIIFVTNGYIPEVLITRMVLGANMKGIKLSFVTGNQLSDWLILNPSKYKFYFEEELQEKKFIDEQLIEFRKVSLYEPVSLDFKPNYDRVSMNVGDTFILSCLIYNTQADCFEIELEDNAPLTFIESSRHENHKKFEMHSGLNVISFLVKANRVFQNSIRIMLICGKKTYYCISDRLIISRNNQLNIYYFEQLNTLHKMKLVIDNFDASIGKYTFFIHGSSGMGKSYILKSLSLDYSINNDLTLVTFESASNSNTNYLLLCRIIIFLQYGNIFWDYNETNIRKFCTSYSALNSDIDIQLLNKLLNGCFDANIAKIVIENLINTAPTFPLLISSRFQKNFRILLLDDIQNLNLTQSTILEILINQQLNSKNNSILVLAGRKAEFNSPDLEKMLLENTSNYFELDKLGELDIKGTILQNFNMKENVMASLIKELPSNLLLLNEILSSFKYQFYEHGSQISNSQFIDRYIQLCASDYVFQDKFVNLKEKFYLLDIIYFFKKGISLSLLYAYPLFDKNILKKDIHILIQNNCIKLIGHSLICPFHDYMVESYKKLRKGKEYNKKTGDYLKFLLDKNSKDLDINYLLSIICKCGKKYFNDYNETLKKTMIQYIQKSEYGVARNFAELFYENALKKKKLSKDDKYYLYLYADCLVHCDNTYMAKQLLERIVENEEDMNFEKYEAAVSLLNQRFWSAHIDGIIEDSKMYQIDLENMFMHKLNDDTFYRFKKAYESCFNRRMVTFMFLDKYQNAQQSYCEGIFALKEFSDKYNLNFHSEIATIIMDYARGNMTVKANTAHNLFLHAINFFLERKTKYVRRLLICQIDLLVTQNILRENVNYRDFLQKVNELDKHNFLLEYIKGILKLYACRLIEFSRLNNYNRVSVSFMADCINQIEKIKLEKHIILQNRELYLYNYILAYFYILQNEYLEAKTCIQSNINYLQRAGATYKIPLEHNLINLETIQGIEWFQRGKKYSDKIYLLDSRFW